MVWRKAKATGAGAIRKGEDRQAEEQQPPPEQQRTPQRLCSSRSCSAGDNNIAEAVSMAGAVAFDEDRATSFNNAGESRGAVVMAR